VAKDIEISVSVSGTKPDEVAQTARALRAAGLEVTSILDQIAVITGRTDETALAAIARVPGVTHIERQGSVKISPPDSGVQ